MSIASDSPSDNSGLPPGEFTVNQPEVPSEYQAFRALLRQSKEPKPVSAPSPSGKG
jgi:hypothetical protein